MPGGTAGLVWTPCAGAEASGCAGHVEGQAIAGLADERGGSSAIDPFDREYLLGIRTLRRFGGNEIRWRGRQRG